MNILERTPLWIGLVLLLAACSTTPTPMAIPVSLPTATSAPAPTETTALFSPSEVSRWGPGQLEIVLMDVKHGDAQLVISPTGETLMIDAGDEPLAPTVAGKLRQILGKAEVDYFLASHYHVDHIGAVVPLFRDLGFVVRKAVLDRGGGRDAYDSPVYRDYYDYVTASERSFQHVRLSPGDGIDLGQRIKIDVLAAGDSAGRSNCGISVLGRNDNDYSIVLWLTFGMFDYWTAGDLYGTDSLTTSDAESACARLVPRPADLIKADHHAIEWNNNANLLKALQPQVALISLDTLGKTDALVRIHKYARVFATNSIIALDDDYKTPIIVEDSDDIIVTSRDGTEFVVEGNPFKSR